MSGILTEKLILEIKRQYQLDWQGIHGIRHWSRVLNNGLEIAKATGANIKVIQLFALFHDSKRENEGIDPLHGWRAARFAESKRADLSLTADEFRLLTAACELHTVDRTHKNITVQTCFDADRLDLPRVGIAIDRKQLCTDAARNLISWATKNALYGTIPDNILGRS